MTEPSPLLCSSEDARGTLLGTEGEQFSTLTEERVSRGFWFGACFQSSFKETDSHQLSVSLWIPLDGNVD